jgi:O-methyltransferase
MSQSSSPLALIGASQFEEQGGWSEGFLVAKSPEGGVVVGPGTDNPNVFGQMFAPGNWTRFRMVARACSAGAASAKGRFQCNWLDAKGKFITSSISKFDVTDEVRTFEYRVTAPEGAGSGVIYVAPGGADDVVRYLEMGVYPDRDPERPEASLDEPRFPAGAIHLSDAATRAGFESLFRGYDDEAVLKTMIRDVMSQTMVTYDGLCCLLSVVRHCERTGLQGDYVEVGAWRGGCAGLMALGARHYGDGKRRIRVYDSFLGLPQPIAEKDFDGNLEAMFGLDESVAAGRLEPIGALVAHVDDTRQLLFRKIAYPEDRVSIHKGWFQETIPASVGGIDRIAILQLNGTLYDSYKVALEQLFPKVASGGFVIIGDWLLEGCRKAVTEYFESRGMNPFLWPFDATTRCLQRA